MIFNATLTRIDRRGASGPTGQPTFVTGQARAIRCFLDDVTGSQKFTLGATIKEASGVAYVPTSGLAAAGEATINQGDRVALQLDTVNGLAMPASYGEVIFVDARVHSTLSHLELFLKAL